MTTDIKQKSTVQSLQKTDKTPNELQKKYEEIVEILKVKVILQSIAMIISQVSQDNNLTVLNKMPTHTQCVQ